MMVYNCIVVDVGSSFVFCILVLFRLHYAKTGDYIGDIAGNWIVHQWLLESWY